jgi:hypothetical protein
MERCKRLAQFHKVSKAGWKHIEDDVDRYCPDENSFSSCMRRPTGMHR